ncbi:MAG: ribonucleoside-diphosphate reductase subunit alpha [Candidatus Margulisbacteria bacterium]|nr:ribonucleoside-diphosphate reductase subunit alpha [Candidatus Margulisiibacteriota bacterium]
MTTSHINTLIKRNGEEVPYDKLLILRAVEKAFLSDNVIDPATVAVLTDEVHNTLISRTGPNVILHVEAVQDIVEEILMKNGYHKIAKNYILYRQEHKIARQKKVLSQIKKHTLEVSLSEKESAIFDAKVIQHRLDLIGSDLKHINTKEIIQTVTRQIYDKISKKEIDLLVLGAARERIERHYDYSKLASRLAINTLYKDILSEYMNTPNLHKAYISQFETYIQQGIDLDILNPELKTFDLIKISQALQPERDHQFYYLGTQILIDRYFLRDRSEHHAIFELPQWFWMRVAMGLSLKEKKEEREDRAISFYNILSRMDIVSSTPTLFNSGTTHSQMSSCYINLPDDSLNGIFKVYQDNANLSKWAGGIGTDWTPIRATGSKIKGTNGLSQGVIPFIKIFNDVALAVNQGGKRKGAMCAYMEVWHLDFEQFLELKKNTGDERRRAHDINTASWVPDLFMKRVQNNEKWTLFCPSDVPELHDLYGKEFEQQYEAYEAKNIPRAKTIKALDMWRKMLTMLYETGHPWLTFKDTINNRNPQDHVGVVHSSNLCTEITLNTSKEETAVCNLASINLSNMIENGDINEEKVAKTIEVGIRMLDNVIDNNFYPTKEAKTANTRHRAIGLGLMGYQDALYMLDMDFESQDNLDFADRSMEMISYYAILSSSKLAKERGTYDTYKGSKWDRGLFPYDTLALLEKERGQSLLVGRDMRMDWDQVKTHVNAHGMRNCNTMAIAPTATIANISGVYPCTEPAFKNIYMKENLSGNFLVINRYLINDLYNLGLWTPKMLNQIKQNNGSIHLIPDIPEHLQSQYKEVFEIDSTWIIKASALRSKWIDQSASTNVFIQTTSGKVLNDIYMMAWEYGLKTTYYLRTLGASQVMKATTEEIISESEPETQQVSEQPASEFINACSIDDPDCEACQ